MGSMIQRSPEPNPATLVGRGKVNEIRAEAVALGASAVVFANDLTPTQLRNLERELDLKVIDRSQVILDIFARRARTREGKLQVELAQLNYLLPRLAGQGTLLSRLGGGIGTRGPGEQQLEFDRRRLRARIVRLGAALERVRSQRRLHRARREEQQFLTVALVGYTNAGKSTLFNALTGSRTPTSERVFATLDPSIRTLELETHRRVLLSDTVGFIRHLPPYLVAAFRATLEELNSASLLLHVANASEPECMAHQQAVEALLDQMGLTATPRLYVWNKIDLLAGAALRRVPHGPEHVAVSALTGVGLPDLRRRIDVALKAEPAIEAEFDLSSSDGQELALLHRSGRVISTQFTGSRVLVRAQVPESVRVRLSPKLAP